MRLTVLKKENRQTGKESKREDLKGADEQNDKIDTRNFPFDHQARFHDSQFLEKVMITVINKKKRRPDEANLYHPNATQISLHDAPQQTDCTPSSTASNSVTWLGLEKIPRHHLMTYRLIAPQSREWRTGMWVAAIDFHKTFNSIQHDAV